MLFQERWVFWGGSFPTVTPACKGLLKPLMHNANPAPLAARRAGPLKGVAQVPGDKSISQRALILGALADGETRITGLLESGDVHSTAGALRGFAPELTFAGPGRWLVKGR